MWLNEGGAQQAELSLTCLDLQGEFEWKLPVLGTWIRYKDPQGKPPCDWWGINYYSKPMASWYLSPTCLPHQIMTDM